MAIINTKDGKRFYIDNKLKKNIDILIDGVRQKDDFVLVVDGHEGSGKSIFAQELGKYCSERLNTNFTVHNIHFKLNDYIDTSLEAPIMHINVLDESRKILNKKASMTYNVRKFTDYMSECRKRQQVHIFCVPAYHDLDEYIIKWRMKGLIHCLKYYKESDNYESGYMIQRGEFKFYPNDEKLKEYYHYKYKYPKKYEIYGRFEYAEVVDQLEYEKKKDDNMMQKYHSKFEEQKRNKEVNKLKRYILHLTARLNEDYQFSIIDLAKLGGWTNDQLKNLRRSKEKYGVGVTNK